MKQALYYTKAEKFPIAVVIHKERSIFGRQEFLIGVGETRTWVTEEKLDFGGIDE